MQTSSHRRGRTLPLPIASCVLLDFIVNKRLLVKEFFFPETFDRLFMDDDSEYEVDESDSGWEESKSVSESRDNTAVLTQNVSFVYQMFPDSIQL